MTQLECTTEQADAVQSYLWQLRDALGLQHWDVFLAEEVSEEDTDASVWPCEGRWVAGVRLSQDFWKLNDDRKRAVLTHELLHLTHRGVAEVIRCSLHNSGFLPQRAYQLLWEQFRLELELMVDHLTAVVAPTMPAWTGPGQ